MLPRIINRENFEQLARDFFEYVEVKPETFLTTIDEQVDMYMKTWDKVTDEGRENMFFNFVNGYILCREERKKKK